MATTDTILHGRALGRAGFPGYGLALATAVVVLAVVYAWWPYQHWQFTTEERGSVLGGWVRTLRIDAEWYFCFVVPPITGFLVYRRRAELAALPLRGTWWGLAPAIMSLLFFWMGYKMDTGYLGFASIQLMVAALILHFGGWAWMRALMLPWLFLMFAWPMYPLETMLAPPLRFFTAKISGALLNVIGISTVREGAQLYSAPDAARLLEQGDRFSLAVAGSCSGIRSLFSLLMISVLYGFVALKRGSARLLLFLSAIPLAVAGNVVRLLLLAIGCLLFGQEFAVGTIKDGFQSESTYHLLAGYAVFAVALAGMFALATAMEGWRHWKGVRLLSSTGRGTGPAPASGESLRPVVLHAAAVLSLCGAVLVACTRTPTTLKMAEPGLVMDLPATVGAFQGTVLEMSSKEKILFDEGVALRRRLYMDPSDRRILATLVMSGPVKKSLHEPTVCLPDQGWTIHDYEQVSFDTGGGRQQRAMLMRIFRDRVGENGARVRQRALNLYWYQGSRGVSTPSYNMSYARTYLDSILRNLNHRWGQAAFWMPVSERPVGLEDPVEDEIAKEVLLEFLGQLTPKILAAPAE